MAAKAISADALRQDTAATLGLLRAIDAVLPGHVEEGFLAFLESVVANDTVLALLAAQLAGAGKSAAGHARTA